MTAWPTIEQAFRKMMFDVYYKKSYAAELDLTVRFVKAIVASATRIPSYQRRAVVAWYEATKGGGDLDAHGLAIEGVARAAAKRAGRRVAASLTEDDLDYDDADDMPEL